MSTQICLRRVKRGRREIVGVKRGQRCITFFTSMKERNFAEETKRKEKDGNFEEVLVSLCIRHRHDRERRES
jgi:hypothetical protein